MKTRKQMFWWIAAVLTIGILEAVAYINICPEEGPWYHVWNCYSGGSLRTQGTLSYTTTTVCSGDLITPPTLTTAQTFNNGTTYRQVEPTCEPPYPYYEYGSVRYMPGPLYFVPAIPTSTNASFSVTAKVDWTPSAISGWWAGAGNGTDSVFTANGSLINVSFASGEVGQAFNFNGTNAYVQIGSTPNISPGTAFTLEAWVKYTAISSNDLCVVAKGQDQSGPMDWSLSIDPTGKLKPQVQVDRITRILQCSNILSSNTWYHVAMTYDGIYLRGYVNGTLSGTTNISGTNVTHLAASGNPLRIGAYAPIYGGANKRFFSGLIDEVSVYNCALSASQIVSIYNAGSNGKCWSASTNGCAAISAGCVCNPITTTLGTVRVNITSTPPVIVTQPMSQTVAVGSDVTLSISVTGCPAPKNQWRFNGAPLVGETNTILALTAVQTNKSGLYSVSVSNVAGFVTSASAKLAVVGVDRVVMSGVFPETSAVSVITNTAVSIQAIAAPADAAFPAGYPVWTIIQQPSGSSLGTPSAGTNPISITPLVRGQYTVAASCGTSTNTFTITVADGTDANYNGIPDDREITFGPNGWQTQLGSWRFDTGDWASLQGQMPIAYTNLQLKGGFSIGAVEISSGAGPAMLAYSELNTNTSIANITYREGSIRFWFRPNWNSGGANGPKQPEARLIESGTKGTTGGSWGMYFNTNGTGLSFCTQTNSVNSLVTNLSAAVSLVSNKWHHVTLTYSATNSILYLDGRKVTNGLSVSSWPSPSVEASGFRIGTDVNGTNWAQGSFDNFETFNYVIPGDYVTNYFLTHSNSPSGGTNINTCPLAPIAIYFSLAQTLTNDQPFYITNGTQNGNYGWLDWDNTYHTGGGITNELRDFNLVTNFVDAVDGSRVLKFGSWIYGIPGNSVGQVSGPLNDLTNNQTEFGVVLWGGVFDGQGQNLRFQAAGYANVVLVDYNLGTSDKWLKFKYRGVRSCNQYYPNDPPLCQIVSPSDSQVFTMGSGSSGIVPITVAASDKEDGLVSIAYYSSTNANLLGTLLYYQSTTNANTNLFTYVWTNAPHGTNYLSAVATDELGAQSTSQTVKAIINWPPAVTNSDNTVIWPDGATSTNVVLGGVVSDDGLPSATAIQWTILSSNGPVSFSATNVAAPTVTFYTNGTYVFRLQASDGAATAAGNCTVRVLQRPFISVVSPTNAAAFPYGVSISITADAYDLDGAVTNVQFINWATNSIGVFPGQTSPYLFTWTNAPLGTNSLAAIATDNDGLIRTSAPPVTVVVFPATTVTISPASQSLCPGQTAVFTANPSGYGPFSYVWKRNGTTLSGQTGSSISLASVTSADAGTYTVEVTGAYRNATNSAVLTVWTNTGATGPVDQTVCPGGSATFSTTASGTGPYSYQWFWNGSALVNKTNNSLVLTNIVGTNAGTYAVIVSGLCSSVSNSAALIVRTNVSVVGPTNLVRSPGQTAIFDTVATGTGPFSYVWKKDGTILSGQTGSSLVISNVVFTNAGVYSVTVSGPCNSVTNSATLSVSQNMSVYITSPTNNAIFVSPASFTIFATVSNANATIQRVDFYANGAWIGSDSSSSSNPYSFTWVGATANGSNYVLTATAVDAYNNTATSLGITNYIVPAVRVSPGPDQVVILTNGSATMRMKGTYSGGYGTVTPQWSQVVGPVAANINDSGATNTTIEFGDATGSYMFLLTATDGWSQDSGTMKVTVLNNNPPVVDAGPNRIISLTNQAALIGKVTDDGMPLPASLTSWWSVVSPTDAGLVFANSNSPITTVTNFPGYGVYTLRLTATDGMATNYGEMTVTVVDPSSRTYTFDADFAEGQLVNINYDDIPNQLQLNRSITPFPFVWIACSGRGTAVKIDANTGEVLGEYRTAPQNIAGNPSRTTVDRYGNAWVCNRDDSYTDPLTHSDKGSVARFGIVIGGIRGDKYLGSDGKYHVHPNPAGHYLEPPFKYCTAVDRDGDGLIKTSAGVGDVLGWDTNSSNANVMGGVSLAEDECIINYTRVTATGARTIAIDANNDLWVGGLGNLHHQKLDGITGQPIPNTDFEAVQGGYGGLIDGHGVLWSANNLMRFDINRRFNMLANPPEIVDPNYYGEPISVGSYGIGIDPNSGNIWVSSSMTRISPDGTQTYSLPRTGSYTGGGIAVDAHNNVWVASHSGGNGVGHYRTDGTWVGDLNFGCTSNRSVHGPTGVAVDSNGKIWTANINTDTAMRINPNAGPRMLNGELNPSGYLLGEVELTVKITKPGQQPASPYNYSDMTGIISLGATEPSGIWRVVHDSGLTNEPWGVVQWTSSEPAGTTIKVEVRAANDESDLSATNNLFRQVYNGQPFTNMWGRYLEIRAVLSHHLDTNATPILYDLSVSTGTNAVIASTANICNSDRATMFENGGPVTITVLNNDVAPAGTNLTITKVSPPANGYVVNTGTNLIYTPNTNFFGVDRFSYTATDGQGGIGRAIVTVVVGQVPQVPPPSNDGPPIAVNTNLLVIGNARPEVQIDVLPMCSDTNAPNPLPIYFKSVTQARHGYARVENCNLSYAPDFGYFGSDVFSYVIANSSGVMATGRVDVTVSGQPTITLACGQYLTNIFTITNTAYSTNGSGYTHLYKFSGNSSNSVTISCSDTVSLNVYDPDGRRITDANQWSDSNNKYWQYVPRGAGTYLVEASTTSSFPVGYSISLSCSSTNVPHMTVLLGSSIVQSGGGIDYVTQVGQPVSASLIITNSGNADLTINGINGVFANGNFIVTDTTLTNSADIVTIPPSSSSNLLVWFEAIPGGQTNAQIYLNNNDRTYIINLFGRANPTNAIPPIVSLTSPDSNTVFSTFGTSCSGTSMHITAHASTSAPGVGIWAVNFYARTTNGIDIPLQQVSGNQSSDVDLDCYWATVPAGNYKLYAVAIDNTGLQTVSAEIPITVLARRSGTPQMTVLFFGTNALPSGSGIDFGIVQTNTPRLVSLTISNSGSGILTNWYDSSWTDSIYRNFYISNPPPNPFTLAAGATRNLTLVFKADYPALFTDQLALQNNDEGLGYICDSFGQYKLYLSGNTTNFSGAPSVTLTNPVSSSTYVAPTNLLLQAVATASGANISMSTVDFYLVVPGGCGIL